MEPVTEQVGTKHKTTVNTEYFSPGTQEMHSFPDSPYYGIGKDDFANITWNKAAMRACICILQVNYRAKSCAHLLTWVVQLSLLGFPHESEEKDLALSIQPMMWELNMICLPKDFFPSEKGTIL